MTSHIMPSLQVGTLLSFLVSQSMIPLKIATCTFNSAHLNVYQTTKKELCSWGSDKTMRSTSICFPQLPNILHI